MTRVDTNCCLNIFSNTQTINKQTVFIKKFYQNLSVSRLSKPFSSMALWFFTLKWYLFCSLLCMIGVLYFLVLVLVWVFVLTQVLAMILVLILVFFLVKVLVWSLSLLKLHIVLLLVLVPVCTDENE